MMNRRKRFALLSAGRDLVWRFPTGESPPAFSSLLSGATWSGKAATALAVDGYEMVTNGDMEDGDPPSSWEGSGTASSVADERTGGAGTQSINIAVSGYATVAQYQEIAHVLGGTYTINGYARKIDATSAWLCARETSPPYSFLVQDECTASVWQELGGTYVATQASIRAYLRVYDADISGESARFDDVSIQLNLAPFVCQPTVPYGTVIGKVITPASGVVPRSLIFRADDALNTWEVRVVPGTAGADLLLGYRNAGAWTNVASADVDWTVDDTDEVAVTYFGQTIEVYSRKSGESVWTKQISETGQSFNATAMQHGYMGWDTNDAFSEVIVSDRRLI